MSRDLDSQPERRDGMRQAVAEVKDRFPIVLAIQHPKREAWVLNGFVCADKREQEELDTIRQELKFDPCEEAERLRYTSATSDPGRNPKRILDRLTNDRFEREEKCWSETRLETPGQRGRKTYLAEFLDEVKEKLLPLLTRNDQQSQQREN